MSFTRGSALTKAAMAQISSSPTPISEKPGMAVILMPFLTAQKISGVLRWGASSTRSGGSGRIASENFAQSTPGDANPLERPVNHARVRVGGADIVEAAKEEAARTDPQDQGEGANESEQSHIASPLPYGARRYRPGA